MGTKKFFSGNTLEQALLQAARHFQLEPHEVAYEQVDRRHGFLKVRRRVVVGVDPDAPGEPGVAHPTEEGPVEPVRDEPAATAPARPPAEAQDASPEPRTGEPRTESEDAQTPPWSGLAPEDAVEAAEEALRRLFRLGDLDLEAQVVAGPDGVAVELRGEDEDQLFEDRGRLLMAIEHLLPRMIRGLTGGSARCRVDSDNFHEVRQEQLRVMAQDAAAEVRRERRMQTLEPMSPDERRIVHLTLADDPAVETESHGSGLFKRVAIRPIRGSAGGDRYSR